MNEPTLEDLVADVGPFVSPPDIFLRIDELMRSDTAGARDFAAVVVQDPGLTARLLRVANSAYFGMRGRVDSVERAVTVVGSRELFGLVLAVSAVSSFSNLESALMNMRTFWRHSVLTGLLARRLAVRSNVLRPERLFVAGMLHDVGVLVMINRIPEVMGDLLTAAGGDETRLCSLEREALGFGHPDLAERLLVSWGLPDSVASAIGHHHDVLMDPATGKVSAGTASVDAQIVHLADALAGRSEIGALFETPMDAGDEAPGSEMPLAAAAALGLGDSDVDAAFADAVDAFTETVAGLTE